MLIWLKSNFSDNKGKCFSDMKIITFVCFVLNAYLRLCNILYLLWHSYQKIISIKHLWVYKYLFLLKIRYNFIGRYVISLSDLSSVFGFCLKGSWIPLWFKKIWDRIWYTVTIDRKYYWNIEKYWKKTEALNWYYSIA